MSKETIGGKTREQWEDYLLKTQRIACLLLDGIKEAEERGDKVAAASIYESYDALLNICVLTEFVVDNHDWKEKDKMIQ